MCCFALELEEKGGDNPRNSKTAKSKEALNQKPSPIGGTTGVKGPPN
jgi:hypothetical protein